MKTLRKLIHDEINQLVSSMLSKMNSFSGSYFEMDSASNEKYSRHLVVHIPENLTFATTQDCEFFVKRICDSVKIYISFSSQSKMKYLMVNKGTEKVSIIDHSVYTSYQNFMILE